MAGRNKTQNSIVVSTAALQNELGPLMEKLDPDVPRVLKSLMARAAVSQLLLNVLAPVLQALSETSDGALQVLQQGDVQSLLTSAGLKLTPLLPGKQKSKRGRSQKSNTPRHRKSKVRARKEKIDIHELQKDMVKALQRGKLNGTDWMVAVGYDPKRYGYTPFFRAKHILLESGKVIPSGKGEGRKAKFRLPS